MVIGPAWGKARALAALWEHDNRYPKLPRVFLTWWYCWRTVLENRLSCLRPVSVSMIQTMAYEPVCATQAPKAVFAIVEALVAEAM